MSLAELIARMSAGEAVDPASEEGELMNKTSAQAREICARINRESSDEPHIRALFSELCGEPVPDSFRCFPPFTADFGKNIHVGENVFINAGCQFQDQGGITIERDALIGHSVIITTLNHDFDPARRAVLHPASVHIGRGAWIGAGVIIVPGVTIGDGAIVGAGSVVTHDVTPNTVVVGNPVRVLRTIAPYEFHVKRAE